MNRADRRKQARDLRHEANRVMAIAGSYEKEYARGCQDGQRYAVKYVYAAVILALINTYGFGRHRLYRVLSEAERLMNPGSGYLTTLELIDEIFRRTGLQICWDDPFDPIEEVEKH